MLSSIITVYVIVSVQQISKRILNLPELCVYIIDLQC